MQKLTIQTPEFIRLETAFGKWLRTLNFEPTTINYNPVRVREFFNWLEKQGIKAITEITKPVVLQYFDYLKERKNQTKGGKLSKNSLRTHQQSLRRFTRYLRETGQDSFEVDIQLQGSTRNIKTIFTKEEIKALQNVCDSDVLGMRDKAMISIYYGCGLRRNEGLNLDVSDILFDKNLVYVRKGKNYKERYVPMAEGVKEELQNYVDYARPTLMKSPVQAVFLTVNGNRIGSNAMAERLQMLKDKAEINKEAGLHALRHSIATHLLQSGMELDKIKRFLGHSSLESTQIYTHLKHGENEQI
jgi:site-specific recombinase XerD